MIKSVFISLLILITITMGCILRMLLRIYRVLVGVASPTDIEKFNTIAFYQNIIWILITTIILGLIALIYIENKNKILKFINNF